MRNSYISPTPNNTKCFAVKSRMLNGLYFRLLKNLFLVFCLVLFSANVWAQNAIVGSGFSDGWGGSCGSYDNFTYLSPSAGTSFIVTRNPTATGTQYWRMGVDFGATVKQMHLNATGNDVAVSPNITYTLNPTCVTAGAMFTTVANIAYKYVFKTADVGTSPNSKMVFFAIQGNVRTITSVSQAPAAASVFPGQSVTVTANISGGFAPGQGIYLRYTNSNYATSTVVQMTGGGTTYTAAIPGSANTPNAAISYYVFTSGDSGPAANGSDANLYTINLNNNAGSNYNYNVASGWFTAASGPWTSASTWTANAVPPTTETLGYVNINHNITNVTADALCSGISVAAGKTLTATSNTITISSASSNTTVTNLGTLNLSGTNTIAFVGAGTHTVSGTVTFNNVSINTGVNFGTASTINNNFILNNGGSVSTYPPFYGINSTLIYNTGSVFTSDLEWITGASTGAGVPQNVTLLNASSGVSFAGSSNFRCLKGNLTIPATNSFALSTTNGGDLKIGGNLMNNGLFNTNSRTVTFNGTTAQLITQVGGGAINFGSLIINNNAGIVQLSAAPNATDINVSGDLTLTGAIGSPIDLNGRTLNMNSAAASTFNILVNNKNINSTVSGAKFVISGAGTKTISGAVTINFTPNVDVQLASPTDFGFNLSSISGTLEMLAGGSVVTNPPKYNSITSYLKYNTAASTVRGLEWSPNVNSIDDYGFPSHEIIVASGTLNMNGGGSDFYVGELLTISSGASLSMGAMSGKLEPKSILINGTLTLSSNGGSKLEIEGGNFTLGTTGNFIHNNKTVIFVGIGTNQIITSISGSTINFYKLAVNETNGAILVLANNVSVSNSLDFTNGTVRLGVNNLILGTASITGISASSYVNTNTTGMLKRTVASSLVVFPVGNSSYNPITLANTGTSDDIGVYVTDGPFAFANNTSKVVNRNWVVTESAAGGSLLSVVAQYNSLDGSGGNYNSSTNPKIGIYDGTVWLISNATLAGSNPYFISSNTAITAPTTSAYTIVAGADDAFISYTTQANGDWATNGTWTCNCIPPAGADVVINHNVTLATNSNTLTSLTINSGANLTLNNNGYLSVSATLNNAGIFTLNGNATFESNSTFTFINSGTFTDNRTAGLFYIYGNNSSISNTSIGTFNLNSSSTEIYFLGANGSFINNGTLNMGAATKISTGISANGFTFTFGSGSVNALNATSEIKLFSSATIYKNTNISFGNLQLNDATTFIGSGTTSIFGKLSISQNTSVSGTTFRYQTGSKLIIFDTGFNTPMTVSSSYWTPNANYSATNGVPYDVGFQSHNSSIILPAGNTWKTGHDVNIGTFNVPGDTMAVFFGATEFNNLTIAPDGGVFASGTMKINGNLTANDAIKLSGTSVGYVNVVGDVLVSATGDIKTRGKSLTLSGANQSIQIDNNAQVLDSLRLNGTGVKTLNSNLNIAASLKFESGTRSLNLNDFNIDLLTSGKIDGESSTNTIVNNTPSPIVVTGYVGTGYIGFTRTIPNGTNVSTIEANNGNIGLALITSTNLGTVTIKRFAKGIAGVGVTTNSINRYYQVSCTNPNTSTIYFNYLDNIAELNGNTENTATFNIYSSIVDGIGASFIPIPTAVLNSSTNTISYDHIFDGSSNYFFTAASADAAYVGNYNLPSATFPNLQALVALFNTSGVGPGGATITIADGYTETLTGPIDFEITLNEPTAANPLIIQGNPLDPPTFTSYAGLTVDRDAFVRILGTDYLTLQNINFVEDNNNNDQITTMEWGIALLKSGPGNGIRYNTIKNCHITMKKLNTIATGIYVGNHNGNPLAPYSPSTTGGSNSNNNIYGNIISGVNIGIFVNSFDSPNNLYQDDNWKIGDTANVALGNLIENFGGEANVPAYGIRAKNTNQIVIGNNTINNNTSPGGVASNNTIKGIELEGSSNSNSFIKYNNISLKQGANAFSSYAIVGNMSGSQSINIERNSIHDNEMETGATGNFYGIYSSTPPSTFNLKNNRISHNTNVNTTGSFTAVYNLGSSNVNVTGNKVDTTVTKATLDSYGYYVNSGGTINCLNNSLIDYEQIGTGGGVFYGYCNDNAVVSAFQSGGGVEEISYNNFSKIKVKGVTSIFGIATSTSTIRIKGTNVNRLRTYTAVYGNVTGVAIRSGSSILGSDNKINNYTTKGNIDGIRMIDGTTTTLDNDSIYDMVQLDNGNTAGINSTIAPGMTTSARIISNNNISNFSNPVGGTGTTYGILHASSGNGGPHTSTNTGNRVIGLTGNGSGATSGILHASSGTGGPKSSTSNNNVIQTIAGNGGGATYGILHASSGTGGPKSSTSNNNTITGISGTGVGTTYGILHASSGTGGPKSSTSNNNVVTGVTGTGSGSTYGILHASSGNGGPHTSSRIGNTISSVSNTGGGNAYGIFHASSTTGAAITQTYTTRNNNINGVSTVSSGSTYGILHASSGTGGPHQQRMSYNSVQNIISVADSAIAIKVIDADSVDIQHNTVGNIRSLGAGSVSGLLIDHYVGNTIGIIANNVIGDMRTTNASGTLDLKGLEIAGAAGTALKLYYNTIVLNDVNTNAGFGSASLVFDNASSIDLRNNIIINKSSTTVSTGVASVLRQIGAGGNFANTSNNNLYYVDSTQINIAIFSDGINPNVTSFSAYKALVAPSGRETSSFKEDAVFMSLNLASPGYLRLDSLAPTKAESGASIITAVPNDRNNIPRFGSVGYLGTGSAPDIGAFEGEMTPAMHIWLGKTSDNWGTASNWTANKLPLTTDDVIIPKVTTPNFQPTVNLAASVKDMSVQNGTTITLNAADLNFSGSTSMYGSGSPNYVRVKGTGTLVTNGNGNTISGTWLVDNFAKTGAATNTTISATSSNLSIVGVYTPISGTMNTNGNLYIRSYNTGSGANYLGSGQIATGSGVISGDAVIERRAPSTLYAIQHFLSAPITEVKTVSDNYGDDFSVSGTYPFRYRPGATPAIWPNTWWYDASGADSIPLIPSDYRWRSARLYPMTSGRSISATMNGGITFDVIGTPQNASSIIVPVRQYVLNQLGNPYPSAIDLNTFLANNSLNVGGNIVYIKNGGSYVSYSTSFLDINGNGVVVNSPFLDKRERFLGHSSGFFAYGKPAATQVVFNNTQRNAYPQLTIAGALSGVFYETSNTPDILKLKLKNIANDDSFDELVIGKASDAADGIDDKDGNKFMDSNTNMQPYMYSIADGQNLVINAIPNTNGKVIPIGIVTTNQGNWSVSTENSDAFVNEVSSLYLEDRSTSPSIFYNLKTSPTMQFSLPEGNIGSRFYLHIGNETVNAATAVKQIQADNNETKVFSNANKLYVDFGTELKGAVTVEVFNITGQCITSLDATNYQGQHEITLNTSATGNYIVKVINKQNVFNQKVWIGSK